MTTTRIDAHRWVSRLGRLAMAAFLTACAGSAAPGAAGQGVATIPAKPQAPDRATRTPVVTADVTNSDDQVLQELWKSRVLEASKDLTASDFMLGPGDVLRISIPLIENLKDRTVRVSEENTIALPMLGEINVSGMNEEDLRTELSHRVRKYMYHPQVDVFVQHTENRQVAVLGSVKSPGRYMLASRSDTLMTMIGRAGGMTEDAASRVILIPASGAGAAGAHGAAVRSQHAESDPPAGSPLAFDPDGSPTFSQASVAQPVKLDDLPKIAGPIEVIIRLSRSGDQRYLGLPARAGDTILVPAAGEVTVQGWVDKPGAFKITPGMTVLGSVAAAGGALFSSSATLLRDQGDGSKIEMPLDLARIKRGEAPDPPLQGGDVIILERSVVGALPYTVYFLISRIGLGVPAS
jgi:polysaccharide export outer membrane protein